MQRYWVKSCKTCSPPLLQHLRLSLCRVIHSRLNTIKSSAASNLEAECACMPSLNHFFGDAIRCTDFLLIHCLACLGRSGAQIAWLPAVLLLTLLASHAALSVCSGHGFKMSSGIGLHAADMVLAAASTSSSSSPTHASAALAVSSSLLRDGCAQQQAVWLQRDVEITMKQHCAVLIRVLIFKQQRGHVLGI
eukprot:1161911-Pelagomonas_calceolata.AAC.1